MDLVSVSLEWIWNRQRGLTVSFTFSHSLAAGDCGGIGVLYGGFLVEWHVCAWLTTWNYIWDYGSDSLLQKMLFACFLLLLFAVFNWMLQVNSIWPGTYETCRDSAIKVLKHQLQTDFCAIFFAGMLICFIWKCSQSITIWSRLIKHHTSLHK